VQPLPQGTGDGSSGAGAEPVTRARNVDISSSSNVQIHHTPTYSTWLNQVELWFNRVKRDVIARGVFSSFPDLKRKLMRYISLYNQALSQSSGFTATLLVESKLLPIQVLRVTRCRAPLTGILRPNSRA
jgi:hypothetical protein